MASNINGLSSFNLRHTTAHECTQIINEQPPQQPPDFRRDTLGRDLPRSSSKSYSDPDGFGGSGHTVCTCALSPSKPRRISVTPAAIQMRVPAGKSITAKESPAPFAATLHRSGLRSRCVPSAVRCAAIQHWLALQRRSDCAPLHPSPPPAAHASGFLLHSEPPFAMLPPPQEQHVRVHAVGLRDLRH